MIRVLDSAGSTLVEWGRQQHDNNDDYDPDDGKNSDGSRSDGEDC